MFEKDHCSRVKMRVKIRWFLGFFFDVVFVLSGDTPDITARAQINISFKLCV
jgi:hypothetical protein